MWRDSANVAKCFSPVLGGSAGGDKTWISSGQLAAVSSLVSDGAEVQVLRVQDSLILHDMV